MKGANTLHMDPEVFTVFADLNSARQRHFARATASVAAELTSITNSARSPQLAGRTNELDLSRLTPGATAQSEHAIAGYKRTLAWVHCVPSIAKENREPFAEKRREAYFNLGRQTEAASDERELKSAGRDWK